LNPVTNVLINLKKKGGEEIAKQYYTRGSTRSNMLSYVKRRRRVRVAHNLHSRTKAVVSL
jgi:hypothetical protein